MAREKLTRSFTSFMNFYEMKRTPPQAPLKKARLRDIAQHAQVSIGTVSRVLTGKSDVAPDLAERVLLSARTLNYSRRSAPFTASPSQPGSATFVIGYLVDAPSMAEVVHDPFLQQFLAGIETAVNTRGGHMLFATCGDEVAAGTIPSMIAENRVQGVVFKGGPTTPDPWLKKLGEVVPTVMLMNSCIDRSIFSVLCDNYAGTYQAMRYLRELGHRRIGFLSIEDLGQRASVLHTERRDAFQHYVPQLDCDPRPGLLQVPTRDHRKESLAEAVEKGVKAFVALKDARPTAILCATDIYAFALLNLAPKYKLAIPSDLSVIGFMNSETCNHSTPPLTSVCLSGDEVGRVAVNLLYERLENPGLLVRHVHVGTRLVERVSCSAPAAR